MTPLPLGQATASKGSISVMPPAGTYSVDLTDAAGQEDQSILTRRIHAAPQWLPCRLPYCERLLHCSSLGAAVGRWAGTPTVATSVGLWVAVAMAVCSCWSRADQAEEEGEGIPSRWSLLSGPANTSQRRTTMMGSMPVMYRGRHELAMHNLHAPPGGWCCSSVVRRQGDLQKQHNSRNVFITTKSFILINNKLQNCNHDHKYYCPGFYTHIS